MTDKIKNLYNKLLAFIIFSSDDRLFIQWFKKQRSAVGSKSGREKRLLIDFTHLGFKKWTFQTALSVIALEREYRLTTFSFYPSAFFVWQTWKSRFIWLSKLIYNKDLRYVRAFGVTEELSPTYTRFLLKKANREISIPGTKDALIKMEIGGIRAGDLLYDTYIKRYKKPTVDLKDKRLHLLYKEACFLLDSYNAFLDKYLIDEVWITHSVYLPYGLLVRLALKKGIRVFCIQNNLNRIFYRLTAENPSQRGGYSDYRKIFSGLDRKDDLRAFGKRLIEQRVSGRLDGHLKFMKYSAYGTNRVSFTTPSNGLPNAVIMLHCFFDSPHTYRSMLFPDFYEWLIHTIHVLTKSKVNIFLKPHPNGLKGTSKVIKSITDQYPQVRILPVAVNNRQIAESFDIAITVHGTVGYEMPFFGIPVVTAGDCTYSSYCFCFHPTSISEYDDLLSQVDQLRDRLPGDYKEQLHEFMYMFSAYNHKGADASYAQKVAALNNFSPFRHFQAAIKGDEPETYDSFYNAYVSAQ